MATVTVTILAGATTGTGTHALGHSNYTVVPIPLALGDLLTSSDEGATTFTLTIDNTSVSDRVFTCILVETTVAGVSYYCTAADVEALSQIVYTQFEYASKTLYETDLSTLFIPMAQKIIDSYVDHNFLSNTVTALLMDGSGGNILMISPPYVPILTLTSVTLGGVNITSNLKAYDSYIAYQGGVFTKDNSSRQNVSATFTYGYASVPADVRYACAQIVCNILADMLRRKMMPDTVSRALQSNSDTVIVSGMAKNANILTPEICSILDQYRYSRMDVA